MMTIRLLSCIALGALLASCGQPAAAPEQQFLNRVVAAVGGEGAIKAAQALVIEAEGTTLNIGQDLTPEAATMEFTISDYRSFRDLGGVRSRTELVRTPRFEYFRGPDPMHMIYGLDGDIAYTVAADGNAQRDSETVAKERRSLYYHHPLPLLRAAISGTAVVGNIREEEGMVVADISVAEGPVLTLGVDAATHIPLFIRSLEHHFYLRDVLRTTRFSGRMSVGGLQLPATISEHLDEFPVSQLTVTAAQVAGSEEDLSAPGSAASAPLPGGTGSPTVTAELLDEGVWLLAGQSHHSVLIEFSDRLLLIEAPNEARTLAVIAKAEELVPGKAVTQVVNTHHHFDHSAGLRAATARGLTIITHAANEAFYRRMADQPSTIVPDLLARSPRPIRLLSVDDEMTIADDTMRLDLYRVDGSLHSRSMLMAHLPEQRLLIQADLYTPGRSVPQRFAPNLLQNLRRHALETDRIVPIHGGVVDFAVLEKAVDELEADD